MPHYFPDQTDENYTERQDRFPHGLSEMMGQAARIVEMMLKIYGRSEDEKFYKIRWMW
jgi:hypothetical protein